MKLAHHDYFEQIEMKDFKTNSLIIESSKYFREIVAELYKQVNTNCGKFFLSDDNSNLMPLNKNVIMLVDFNNFDSYSKNLKSKINQEIFEQFSEDELSLQLIKDLSTLSEEAENSVRYPIKFRDDITLSDILKMLDISIDYEGLSSLEKILQFMEICHDVLGTKLFITVNLMSYLSDDEFLEFNKSIELNEITLLMIERNQHSRISNGKLVIIDKDLCVI